MHRSGVVVAFVCVLGVTAGLAQASPILTQGYPDIYVTSNIINYIANSHTFTATGRPTTFTVVAGSPNNITSTTTTSYSLSATINSAGVGSSGTLSVGGKIAGLSATSGTLLTGSFVDFGHAASSNGDPFEFVFNVTGGDLASYYGGLGGKIGVIIGAKSTNFVSFASDFSSPAQGATNDTFATPEPASLCLLLVGSLAALRRRNGR